MLTDTTECFLKLAPPSVAFEITGKDTEVDLFWLLLYAAWHFRFDEKNFDFFKSTFAKNDNSRAEEILNNLLLHALASIEVRFLWARQS